MNASRALKEASMVITESPAALQLRYLQTLTTIAAEKNSTIVFPLPINMLQGLLGENRQVEQEERAGVGAFFFFLLQRMFATLNSLGIVAYGGVKVDLLENLCCYTKCVYKTYM